MLVDIGEVRKHIKPKADSTLRNMRKDDLIEYIRCLENNYNVAVSFNENQAKYIESLDVSPVVHEWISVEDRLPQDREWVLVWHTGYKTPKKAFHKDDLDPYLPIFRLDGDNGLKGDVTHWMPLPQPPKGE